MPHPLAPGHSQRWSHSWPRGHLVQRSCASGSQSGRLFQRRLLRPCRTLQGQSTDFQHTSIKRLAPEQPVRTLRQNAHPL